MKSCPQPKGSLPIQLLRIASECIVTHMKRTLCTADVRRSAVIESAIFVFAKTGYLGTPIATVAKHAKISPAYVFKLFPTKEQLFVAALDATFTLIQIALSDNAEGAENQSSDQLLQGMGAAYAGLIEDRNLLLIQVHALSAADVPEIATAFRNGLQMMVTFVKSRTGASDEAVQRFFAYGQLCHLITTLSIRGERTLWEQMLTAGMRHT